MRLYKAFLNENYDVLDFEEPSDLETIFSRNERKEFEIDKKTLTEYIELSGYITAYRYNNKMDELQIRLQQLEEENAQLRNENKELLEKLKKNDDSRKKYYEEHKDVVNEKAKQRLKKMAEENPDKLKEYRRTAYLNRKEKLKNTMKIEPI